ncbi:hypothetical protein EVAR_15717_1 [Eumeta japonica]|uniref:Uncharacterized protein n=1 Tax=Eumeta variegata TaxID=151549 RepID=A0A4C1U9I4_EUMVA|nr:hypothetical protein EVAR_15717_1 [Eumeta japonica]
MRLRAQRLASFRERQNKSPTATQCAALSPGNGPGDNKYGINRPLCPRYHPREWPFKKGVLVRRPCSGADAAMSATPSVEPEH